MTWYAVGPTLRKQASDEEWFHGSSQMEPFDKFDITKSHQGEGNSDSGYTEPKHWNCHLGSHFTSDHQTAAQIAFPHSGTVYHCDLAMKHPKHYYSEKDLDREAYQWARDSDAFDGFDSFYDDPAHALRFHPQVTEIAKGFKQHLRNQGHDGITYGNEYEGPHLHECAIAFRPKDITINSVHHSAEPCSEGDVCQECLHPHEKQAWGNCSHCGAEIGDDTKTALLQHFASAADRYVTCDQGHTHWGSAGAAGLLIRHTDDQGTRRYLLQHRSPWVQHGNTWSTPGGALHHGESPEAGAMREGEEEMGDLPGLTHAATHTDDHGGWKYHTVVMDAPERFTPGGDEGFEHADSRWVTPEEMKDLPLHPGFKASWDKTLSKEAISDFTTLDPAKVDAHASLLAAHLAEHHPEILGKPSAMHDALHRAAHTAEGAGWGAESWRKDQALPFHEHDPLIDPSVSRVRRLMSSLLRHFAATETHSLPIEQVLAMTSGDYDAPTKVRDVVERLQKHYGPRRWEAPRNTKPVHIFAPTPDSDEGHVLVNGHHRVTRAVVLGHPTIEGVIHQPQQDENGDWDYPTYFDMPNFFTAARSPIYRFTPDPAPEGLHSIYRGLYLGPDTMARHVPPGSEGGIGHLEDYQPDYSDSGILDQMARHHDWRVKTDQITPGHPALPMYGSHWTESPSLAHQFALDASHGRYRVPRTPNQAVTGVVLEAQVHDAPEHDALGSQFGESEVKWPGRGKVERVLAHVHRYDPEVHGEGPMGFGRANTHVRTFEIPAEHLAKHSAKDLPYGQKTWECSRCAQQTQTKRMPTSWHRMPSGEILCPPCHHETTKTAAAADDLVKQYQPPAKSVQDILDLLGPGVKPAQQPTQEESDAAEADRQARERAHQKWQSGRKGYSPGDDLTGWEGYPHAEWVPIEVAQHFRDHTGDQHKGSQHIVDAIAEELKAGRGMTDPLMLLHHNEQRQAHLGEGNHRLAAAEKVGWSHVPMRVVRMYDGEARTGKGRSIPMQWVGSHSGRTPELAPPSQVFPFGSKAYPGERGTGEEGDVGGDPRVGSRLGGSRDPRPPARARSRIASAVADAILRRFAAGDDSDGLKPLTWHRAADKEFRRLDKPAQKAVQTTLDALQRGDPNLQTHALYGDLKGWYSTKASRGHRIVHQPTDDGGIYIGGVSLHEYPNQRLGARQVHVLPVADFIEQFDPGEYQRSGAGWSEVEDHPAFQEPSAFNPGRIHSGTWDDFVHHVGQHGIQEPVEVDPYDNTVSEGHHRVVAAMHTGRDVPYTVKEYSEGHPLHGQA